MRTVALGDLVSIQTGKLDANASSPDGAYPFFTCAREPLRIANWKYDLDAILIAGNGDLNIKHYRGKFDAYQRTYILSANTPNVHTRYLYHFLDKYLEKLREQSIGGIIKYIKLGMLTEAPIPLPPLDEQKRIAGILDQADALRTKRQHALTRLNQLGQAIFYEMFGDISLLPRTHAFQEIATIQHSLVDPKLPQYQSALHVGPEHIASGNGVVNWDAVRTAQEDAVISGKNCFESQDILYSKIRPYLNKVALADRSGICSADMYVIKPIVKSSEAHFLRMLLMGRDFLSYAETCSNRANIPKLNRAQVEGYRFYCPSIEKQTSFSERLNRLAPLRRTYVEALEGSSRLFTSLQHRAFRGELTGSSLNGSTP